ncbi:MAG: hypothetical protein RIG62_30935 [Cyclobacteriaceae bacterium]
MNNQLLIFFFCFFSFSTAFGQNSDYSFKVLASDGEVYYRAVSAEEWQPIEIGTVLNDTHLVKVTKSAYLGLVHKSGKTLPFSKPGTYEISRLHQRMNHENSKVAEKYADAYIASMNNRGVNAQETTRSIENRKLKMFLPNSVDVFSPEVVLRWKDQEEMQDDYEVVFKNMFDEVLMVKDANDTKLWLDFDQEPIASERLLIVSVQKKAQKDVQSNSYGIKHMTADESALIEQELQELKLVFAGEESALDKLILASFYEQNNLLADALTCYEYAIALSPVDAFRTAYDQFIFRNGLGL